MAYRVTPYAYKPGNTFLHRIPPGIKLLGLLIISMGSFFSQIGIFIGLFFIILGALCARIRPWELFRGSGPLFGMILLVILLRFLRFNESVIEYSFPGLKAGLLFGVKILLSFSAGSLFFGVTTMTELRDSLGALENTLGRVFFKKEKTSLSSLSLGISLMLGFLPRFFEIWESAEDAYQARAGKKGIPKIFLLIPLVTERMIVLALETAEALESRGASL